MSWPVELRGVTESVVTTLGPNGRWNVAALGLHADGGTGGRGSDDGGRPVRSRTWGRTRTWRNFTERGEGYVQFTRDPVDFTEAALAVREEDDPVLDSADAWVRVAVERVGEGAEGGTEWVDWHLHPEEAAVEREVVPTTRRGHGAVVEATVAASRLDVEAYDTDELRDRLDYFVAVIERCGGPREQAALARLRELVEW
ncbi:MAG: DUF447 domain-containing protein [Haloarculaceae archaeon]